MPLRKKHEDVDLDKILNPYHASTMPVAAPPSAVASVRCSQCKRATMFDARRPRPRRCAWCRSFLP